LEILILFILNEHRVVKRGVYFFCGLMDVIYPFYIKNDFELKTFS